jgi:chromosome segregation ATPase
LFAVCAQEREAFHAEVTGERRRLAEEAAATSRAAEEARANLLDLKGRLAEYEASAAAALRQARQEEERAAGVRANVKSEQEQLATAKKELEVRAELSVLTCGLVC